MCLSWENIPGQAEGSSSGQQSLTAWNSLPGCAGKCFLIGSPVEKTLYFSVANSHGVSTPDTSSMGVSSYLWAIPWCWVGKMCAHSALARGGRGCRMSLPRLLHQPPCSCPLGQPAKAESPAILVSFTTSVNWVERIGHFPFFLWDTQ